MVSSSSSSPPSPCSDKRQKLDEDVEMSDTRTPSSSPLTEIDVHDGEEKLSLTPLPDSMLLLHLPSILIHPPNHPLHARSLCMSLLALRRCLKVPGLSPDIECRALTSLAEVGMIVIDGGFNQQEQHVWAQKIEPEVEEATSKGLMIAQKHPSLRIYRSQLTFLAAQLAAWQNNIKFARMLLRRLLTTYLPSDPPHIVYTAHLKFISNLITPIEVQDPSHTSASNVSPAKLSQDVRQTMSAIQAMHKHALKYGHNGVVLLTRVLRLRHLVSSGLWDQVSESLIETEEALGLEFLNEQDAFANQPAGQSPRKGLRVTDLNTVHMNPPSPTKLSTNTKLLNITDTQPSTPASESAPGSAAPTFKLFDTYFERSMALHTLIIGVVFYTYVGRLSNATQRLSHLHALLDAGALRFDNKTSDSVSSAPANANIPDPPADSEKVVVSQTEAETQENDNAACGIVRIPLSESTPPLYVQTTHPRVLYIVAFLVSCVAKKDPVGRRPKRKIFAIEGLSTWERELKKELHCKFVLSQECTFTYHELVPTFASLGYLEEIDLRLAKIKADLMCELVGVSIMRSEFDAAEQTLSVLIAHLRNAHIFPSFSARVSLHHAHLAHAKGQTDRAMQCYRVAEIFSEERGDDFVRISARAGRACLKIGLIREKECSMKERVEAEKQKTPKRKTRGKSKERKASDDAMDVDQNAAMIEAEITANEWEDVQKLAEDVAEACRGMGGTMWSVGRVIEACITDEILKSKQHLKSALSFASSAGDNHLRALILALIASHYIHTATDDALGMLGMCENLAAGLGAAVKPLPGAKGKEIQGDAVGNAPLRTWVGDRSLEIYKRTGNGPAAKKQEAANRALQTLLRKAEKRSAKDVE
ncbi:hypothetical protein DFH05DRAFT_129609 [Lentinula detonsa]|uniref:Uncharacterized protein n=1 Tax=Lentinula detonsa TaxID=2804962 RepID=A0A9W8PBP0_9AGAR|nr:hypothetical protein DFH05DRAFT_129609 [Lentinula detonsa]